MFKYWYYYTVHASPQTPPPKESLCLRYEVYCRCRCRITLRTPWSWQKYCLNHCARTCCSLRIVTSCRFMNSPIRGERGGRNMHFLSINLISFRRSRGIVLVTASPAREMDGAGRQWNIDKDVRNVREFSVKRLPSGGTRSCMPQQTRYAGVCVPAGSRNSACFEVDLIRTVIDHVTVSERAA